MLVPAELTKKIRKRDLRQDDSGAALTRGTVLRGHLDATTHGSRHAGLRHRPADRGPRRRPGDPPAGAAARVPDPTTSTLRQLAAHTGDARRHGGRHRGAGRRRDLPRRGRGAQFDSGHPRERDEVGGRRARPQGRYDFAQADTLVAFARAHGQLVRGHTLVWHNQLPAWLTSRQLDREPSCGHPRQHIIDRGRPLPRPDLGVGRRQRGVQRRRHRCATHLAAVHLGPGYIADAFRWAHQADPHGDPVLQRLQHRGHQRQERRGVRAASSRCRRRACRSRRRRAGPPRHPVRRSRRASSGRTCAASPTLGMDSRDHRGRRAQRAAGGPRPRAQAQSAGYSAMLQGCLLVRRCLSFTVWGFTDKYQWVPGRLPGRGLGRAVGRELPAQARVRPGAPRPRARAVRAAARLTEPTRVRAVDRRPAARCAGDPDPDVPLTRCP